MATCQLPAEVEAANNNGHIADKVMGITTPEGCCEACAMAKKGTCVKWVLGKTTRADFCNVCMRGCSARTRRSVMPPCAPFLPARPRRANLRAH